MRIRHFLGIYVFRNNYREWVVASRLFGFRYLRRPWERI